MQLFRKPDWATCIATTMNSVDAFDKAAGWTDAQEEAIRIEDQGDWHHTPSESSSLCSHCPRSAVAVIVVPVRSSSDMLSLSLFSALCSHCSLTIYMPSTRDSGMPPRSRIDSFFHWLALTLSRSRSHIVSLSQRLTLTMTHPHIHLLSHFLAVSVTRESETV